MSQLAITAEPFGHMPDGAAVQLFTLTNAAGLQVRITNYGGIVTSVLAPDRHGRPGDVVLGFDTLAEYQQQEHPYFGALIGRYANRIAHGRFSLEGQSYRLAANNGPNHLHGGQAGFDKRLWQAEMLVDQGAALRLTYISPDGEEGYPGAVTVSVIYQLTPDNALRIDYTATTDRATPLNLTNHSYFNLAAGAAPDCLGHQLTIHASRYTAVNEALIPTGELPEVSGTPMDFRHAHTIGERIEQVPGGYDHNWAPDGAGLRAVASVLEPGSGRTLDVWTDQPGLQFYSGNFLDATLTGKGGTVYPRHYGFCLETQHFPDSPNQPGFPPAVLRPGEVFRSSTLYRFGAQAG